MGSDQMPLFAMLPSQADILHSVPYTPVRTWIKGRMQPELAELNGLFLEEGIGTIIRDEAA